MDSIRVSPGAKPELAARSPEDTLGLENKEVARERRTELVDRIGALQERLFAEGSRSVLLVLQGLDGSGKDSVIRGVFTGINPQGCHVSSFRVPSSTELAHDYLWRIHAALPPRGVIGCLLYTSPSPRDVEESRMPSSA